MTRKHLDIHNKVGDLVLLFARNLKMKEAPANCSEGLWGPSR